MIRVMLPSAAFAAGLILSAAALAHAHFVSAMPSANSTVPTAPNEVAINYTEGVEPLFSSIKVQNASGARVDTGKVHTAPNDNKRLFVRLKPLAAGTYTVTWHVTSVDTHKTQGTFVFTVRH
jgi:methionine-rich copper-binding protein CopC